MAAMSRRGERSAITDSRVTGHDTSTPPQARADRVRLFAATPQ